MSMVQIDWNPDRKTLRQFGFILAGLLVVLGTWIHFRHAFLFWDFAAETAERTSTVLWSIAAAVGALAAIAPGAVRPIHILITIVALPIGFVISHVLLAFMFFGVLGLAGLVFRLLRRDPLTRSFDPECATYWAPRTPVSDMKQYYRQY